jgi:acetyl esterase/lipase
MKTNSNVDHNSEGNPDTGLFYRLFVFEMPEDLSRDPTDGCKLIEQLSFITGKYGFKFAVMFNSRRYETDSLFILNNFAKTNGFLTAITVYDEDSVDKSVNCGLDIIGIPNPSFTDWPLLEKIALTSKPIMAFTAHATLDEMERVHLFFKNRRKIFCLMHFNEHSVCCESFNFDQIDFLKRSFPETPVGSYPDESPDNMDAIKIQVAKGAVVFERRIAAEPFDSPDYSSALDTTDKWISSAAGAFKMCRAQEPVPAPRGSRRGVFAKRDLPAGSTLYSNNIYFTYPCADHQLSANEISKKAIFTTITSVKANEPIALNDVREKHIEKDVVPLGHCPFEEAETTIGGVNCYSISKPDSKENRVIVYAHGGGYVSGSAIGSRGDAVSLAACSGCNVLSVDYRLAPEHPFPAAVEDFLTVYRRLLNEGRSPCDVGFYGESAGGGIVLASTMILRDAGDNLPAAVACSSPWADLANTGDSHSDKMNSVDIKLKTRELQENARMYARNHSLLNPCVSPAYGDFSGFPPLLIYAGTMEILLDDARRVAEKAKEEGVEVELKIVDGMPHAFTSMTGVFAEADEAMREIGRFFSRCIGDAPQGDHFERSGPVPAGDYSLDCALL